MAGLDCSLGQCSALSIRRTQRGVDLRVSWAVPRASAQPQASQGKKKSKSPSTRRRSRRRGEEHRERRRQQQQPGLDRQRRQQTPLDPEAQPFQPSGLDTRAAVEAMDTAPDLPAGPTALPSPSPIPIPSPAQQPPPLTPGFPACPGVLVEAGESAGTRRREDAACSGSLPKAQRTAPMANPLSRVEALCAETQRRGIAVAQEAEAMRRRLDAVGGSRSRGR